MLRSTCLAAGVALAFASLSGCHLLALPLVVNAGTAIGIASGVVSVAKDVLELDVTARQIFAPPAASPAAIQ
jgi:hypothetical protein